MDLRPLGGTGVRVSPLGLGALNFGGSVDEKIAAELVLTALDGGVNFIDTADMYNGGESERIVGQVLNRTGRRDEVVLATKVGMPTTGDPGKPSPDPNMGGGSRRHIIRACEASLRRLGTDRIDLYQLHRPSFDIDPEETLRAFDDLVSMGKVVNIGCSTHPAWFVHECLSVSERHGWARYVSEQPPYNLLDRRIENELVPFAKRHGLAILPWSPLAGGVLAGRYRSVDSPPADSRAANDVRWRERVTEPGVAAAREVAGIASEAGLTSSQLALLWLRDQPGVTSPIIGPRTLDHLRDALAIGELAPLDDAILAALDAVVAPGTYVTDFHNRSGWTPRTRVAPSS